MAENEPRDRSGRWRSAKFLGLGLLWLPGAFVIALTLATVDVIAKMWTGVAQVDALAPATAAGVLGVYRPVTPSQFSDAIFAARALAAIANAEQSFDGSVGDTDAGLAPGGPSISPWQIERVNAIAQGWYATPSSSSAGDDGDRSTYAVLPTTGLHLYVYAYRVAAFFKAQVAPYANGDLTTALRVWNGGPTGASKDATAEYAQKSAALIADWANG